MIGTQFGNYRIEAKLGAGGMGVVYKAFDTELDRPVAIKTLLATDSSDPGSLARFLREAKAASRLQHSSIVTIHHFGVEGDTRYIVMEFVEGKTLKKIISGKPIAIDQFFDIGIQTMDGIALAHEKGIIHRDLKAENIMVTTRGQVKILDFGLAKIREAESANPDDVTVYKTQAGLVIGTVSHMSPEQAMGKEVDVRSDIFSMGVVFYEMATGAMPFDAPTPQATLARVLDSEPTPVYRLNPDIPPELERLIHQCLNKNRDFRPDAAEVLARLKALQAAWMGGEQVLPTAIVGTNPVYAAGAGYGDAATLGSGEARPPSGARATGYATRPASSGAMTWGAQAQPAPPDPKAKAIYQAVKTTRIVLSLALLTIPLAYVLYFVVGGGIIRQQAIEDTFLMSFMRAVVVPVMQLVDRVFAVRLVSGGWNFMLLILGVGAFILRFLLLMPFERVEHKLRLRVEGSGPRRVSRLERM
ncbi:MAG TPA: serine/threonine-protein kinase [Terriglobales bacterium]|nr:serine/threonine-protein kinase [Terriglobales bacterium]